MKILLGGEKIHGKVIVEERKMGDVEEISKEIERISGEIRIEEDPLEFLLEMRKRAWD